jgi:hypothetical protein
MKPTSKIVIIGVALLATLIVVLLLLREKKQDAGHFDLVPLNTVALATLDLEMIYAKAGEEQLMDINSLVSGLGSGYPELSGLLKEMISNHASSGIDHTTKGVLFMGKVGSDPLYVTLLALKGDKKIRNILKKVTKNNGIHEKFKGYRLFYRSGFLVAYSESVLMIMQSMGPVPGVQLKEEFSKLTGLDQAQRFFPNHPRSAVLLERETEILCWTDMKSFARIMHLFPGKDWLDIAPESLSDVILSLSFHNGEVTLEAEFLTETRAEIVKIHGRAAQVERLFRFHRSDDLLLALSLAKNEELPLLGNKNFTGITADQLYQWIEQNIPVEGIGQISAAIRERLMLTVTHPEVSIGSLVDDVMHNRADEDNPFALINPDIRMTIIVDPDVFDSLLPQMIRNKIFVREGKLLRFLPGVKPLPFVPSAVTQFYARRIDDVLLIGNKRDFIATADLIGFNGEKKFTEVQKREYANHNLTMHLHVDKLYAILGSSYAQGGTAELLDQAEVVHLRVDPSRVRLVISFRDKKRNSLNLLLSGLFSN